jgi:hypothetical protein
MWNTHRAPAVDVDATTAGPSDRAFSLARGVLWFRP